MESTQINIDNSGMHSLMLKLETEINQPNKMTAEVKSRVQYANR